MKKTWIVVFVCTAPLLAGCAEFMERQRLKTEMMREAVGMMRGMRGGYPPGFSPESVTAKAIEPAAPVAIPQ